MDLVLTPAETRVLGSLLEKERTVPATYPLTLNALVTACNQATSREPVMELGEAEIEAAIDVLKAHRLVRKVLPSHGNRTVKYRQVADEHLALTDDQRAVLTVLMLRGPQTPQELKTRTDRLHAFADADAVTETLEDMARWGDPLVRLLPRGPGQRDARWAHLLAGEPPAPGDATAARPSATSTPAATGGGPAVAPAPTIEPEHHGPLVALVGTWTDDAGASVEVQPVAGRPVLTFRLTPGAGDGTGGEVEVGFLRLPGDGTVVLAVASAAGTAAATSGYVEPTADGVEVLLDDRTLTVAGDALALDLAAGPLHLTRRA